MKWNDKIEKKINAGCDHIYPTELFCKYIYNIMAEVLIKVTLDSN